MFLNDLSAQVMGLFEELDARTAQFRTVSGLQCPTGCGACCLSHKVEATVLEFLPLAMSLLGSDAGDQLLDRLSQPGLASHCVLYDSEGQEGHCSAYAHRGVVCRLFGFAGILDRHRMPQLAACKVMRAADPPMVARAEELIALEPTLLPLFTEAGVRLSAMDPGLGAKRLPINEALREALAKVEVMRLYTGTVNMVVEEPVRDALLFEDGLEAHGPFPGEFGNETGAGGVQ
nr:YkgJ family cysteine cluster protein [uncultured Desulfobulbus sp.]